MFDWPGWLALVLAIAAAALRLFRTRSLLRHIDDPALPERLARRNLTAVVFGMVLSLEIIVWPRYALGTVPLLIVLSALAGWPLRRALFSETWSFPSYLWFYARLVFAIYGFWIALVWSAFLPISTARVRGRGGSESSCWAGTKSTAGSCASSPHEADHHAVAGRPLQRHHRQDRSHLRHRALRARRACQRAAGPTQAIGGASPAAARAV